MKVRKMASIEELEKYFHKYKMSLKMDNTGK